MDNNIKAKLFEMLSNSSDDELKEVTTYISTLTNERRLDFVEQRIKTMKKLMREIKEQYPYIDITIDVEDYNGDSFSVNLLDYINEIRWGV